MEPSAMTCPCPVLSNVQYEKGPIKDENFHVEISHDSSARWEALFQTRDMGVCDWNLLCKKFMLQ